MKKVSNIYMEQVLIDGIVIGTYKEGVTIDLEAAKQSVKERKELTDYTKVPALADARNMVDLTKEARNYFGSEEGYELLSATAILTDSVLSSFIVNFFIKVNLHKTSIPVKMFSNQENALSWLNQYK